MYWSIAMESGKPDKFVEREFVDSDKDNTYLDNTDFKRIFKNLEALAKKHDAVVSLALDGTEVVKAKLEPKKDEKGRITKGIIAKVSVKDYRKLLFSPELIKTALSLMALRKKFKKSGSGAGDISIALESGFIKRLFSKDK